MGRVAAQLTPSTCWDLLPSRWEETGAAFQANVRCVFAGALSRVHWVGPALVTLGTHLYSSCSMTGEQVIEVELVVTALAGVAAMANGPATVAAASAPRMIFFMVV